MRRLILLVAVSLVVAMLLTGAAVADSPTLSVVASGLNNPRGITLGPDGALYVAEAGTGGTAPCAAAGPGEEQCFGATGSITRIDLWRRYQERIVTGLPSFAPAGGNGATGPHDISFSSRTNGFIAIGLGGDPRQRAQNWGAGGATFGYLLQGAPGRGWRGVNDVSGYEAAGDPDGGGVDSNPYAVLALPGRQLVVDAGGNDLVQIDAWGNRTTLAVFPPRQVDAPPFLGLPAGAKIPMQAVPTSVAVGPDGAYYVGQLTGFPFPVGAANVYRVPAQGGTPEVYASGFTGIIDVAFDRSGNLYVVEIARNSVLAAETSGEWPGAVTRVAPNGAKTVVAEGLFAPGGVAVAPDGTLYVTNKSVLKDVGEVVAIRP